jgi:hypothetical protein
MTTEQTSNANQSNMAAGSSEDDRMLFLEFMKQPENVRYLYVWQKRLREIGITFYASPEAMLAACPPGNPLEALDEIHTIFMGTAMDGLDLYARWREFLGMSDEVDPPEAALQRLRIEKAEFEFMEQEEGRQSGRAWAARTDFAKLRRISKIDFEHVDEDGAAAHLEHWMGMDMLDRDDPNDHFVHGFCEGANEVWQQL